MAIQDYSVLKGVASEFALDDDNSPHLEIRIEAAGASHRIAVNVRSKIHPHDLLYLKIDNFQHPLTQKLKQLEDGVHTIKGGLDDVALDYVRGGILTKDQMSVAPYERTGPNNDLRDFIEPLITDNLNNSNVHVYAFGEPWGPDSGSDKYFGFSPKRGIHNIHMNQGSKGRFSGDNGVNQDGALLIHFVDEDRWVAFFLAFQSQSWVTDQNTGHAVHGDEPTGGEKPARPEQSQSSSVRIVAALINPYNPEKGKESITLMNRSDADVDLNGWALVDKEKRKLPLSGALGAGEFVQMKIGKSQPMMLSNKGGSIELQNADGMVVDRATYGKSDVQQEGWTTLF